MENKEFPETDQLIPPDSDAPSYEDDALPEGDLLLMDTAQEADESIMPEMPPLLPPEQASAEELPSYDEPPMSDEAFRSFMLLNALPEEPEQPAEVSAEPVFEATVDPIIDAAPAGEPIFESISSENPEAEIPEDPLAPECDEIDSLEKELLEAQALIHGKAADEKFLDKEQSTEEFSQLVHAQAEEEPIPVRDRPVRKGRPKRKKGEGLLGIPNLLVTAVWLAVIVMVGVTLGRMLWVCAADVLAFGREDHPVTITIYESDSIEDITDKLHKANLIKYPGLFKLYAKLAVDEGEIRPGIWDLNTRYDYHALVSMMSPSSSRSVVEIMIPEGYSCAQIFSLLEENKVCTAQDLASYAATGELDYYWFLDGIPRGESNCLEGYLFPDTYQFYTNDSPRSVLQKMLNNFDYRFTDEMLQQLPTLNEHISDMMRYDGRSQEYIDSHQLTLKDVVIIASLIEKETSSAEEGYTIASVIYNRLYKWGDTPAYLNIDAAMVYALGGKTDLTAEDLRIDHPYNTYLYTGLTPGPISNPGLSSLKAALAPADSPYYYYVLDPSAGEHHFSTTYEEHQAFIASMGD